MVDGRRSSSDDDGMPRLISLLPRVEDRLRSHVDLVKRIQRRLTMAGLQIPPAGLNIVGQEVPVRDIAVGDLWIQNSTKPVDPQPISFYTWNDTLKM